MTARRRVDKMSATDGPFSVVVKRSLLGPRQFAYRIARRFGAWEPRTLAEGHVKARDFDAAWLRVDAMLARLKASRPRRLKNGWRKLAPGCWEKTELLRFTLRIRCKAEHTRTPHPFRWHFWYAGEDGDVTAKGDARTFKAARCLLDGMLRVGLEALPPRWSP